MLELAGDLGFMSEPDPALRVVGVILSKLLECHLPMQFSILGDPDLSEAALGMEPEAAETGFRGLSLRWYRGVPPGSVCSFLELRRISTCAIQLVIADLLEVVPDRGDRGHGRRLRRASLSCFSMSLRHQRYPATYHRPRPKHPCDWRI